MGILGRYASVLAPSGIKTAFAASLLGRLSVAMTSLAIILLVKQTTGSYGIGGVASASYSLALAFGSPARARSADRRGPIRVMAISAILHPLAFVLLALAAHGGLGTPILCLTSALIGVTIAPLGSVMRAMWAARLDEQSLVTAYSLESVLVEVNFVLGPILVTLLSAFINPTAPLIASAAIASASTLWLTTSSVMRAVVPHPERTTSFLGPLTNPTVRACLSNVLFIGIAFGAVELGVIAFVDEHGQSRGIAGAVLAIWSAGSAVGGLIYGVLHVRKPVAQQIPVIVTLMAFCAAAPMLARGTIVLAGAMFLFGLTIAPFMAANSVLVSASAPEGTVTEAFAWNTSMIFGGASLGTAIAGWLVEANGASACLVACAIAGACAAISAIAGPRKPRVLLT